MGLPELDSPEEFGALAGSGGVSSLRSRFEQLSQSEKGIHGQQGVRSSRSAFQCKSGQSPLAPPDSSPRATLQTQNQSATLPVGNEPHPSLASGLLHANTLPGRGKHGTNGRSTGSRIADLVDRDAAQIGNASSSSKLQHQVEEEPQTSPAGALSDAHAFVPSEESGPSSGSSLSSLFRFPADPSSGLHTSTTKGKVPPPRPPKPSQPAAKEDPFQDTNQTSHSDREEDQQSKHDHHIHLGVSSLINHFAHRSVHTIDPPEPSKSEHFTSSSQHQHSKSVPPAIPAKPLKANQSFDSLLSLPGATASLLLDSSLVSANPTPPPLPSRDRGTSPGGRFTMSGSSSSGSLTAVHPRENDSSPSILPANLPPLPARKATASSETTLASDTAVRPPPQRTMNSDNSSSSLLPPPNRSAKAASLPAGSPTLHPRLPNRPPQHAASVPPVVISNTEASLAPLPPPPLRMAASIGISKGRPLAAAPPPVSSAEPSDSSSDEDDILSSSISGSTSRLPLSAGRPLGHASTGPAPSDLPDASHANRRAPAFKPDCYTSSKAAFQAFALNGHTLVTGSGDKVKVYRVGDMSSGVGEKLCTVGEHGNSKEIKLTALEFKPPTDGEPGDEEEGRYVWCGTKEGHLWELDVYEAAITDCRSNIHSSPIQLLQRVGNRMISMDDGGKISIWLPSTDPTKRPGIHLSNQPLTQRISLDKHSFAVVLGQQLWVSTGPETSRSHSYVGSKGPRIRIYNPFADDRPFNAVSKAVGMSAEMANGVGRVTCGTIIPAKPELVYLGHDSGHVSTWSRATYECVGVQRLGSYGITALCGVVKYLWAGNRTGNISVYNVEAYPWRAMKVWPAHKEPITSIHVDGHGVDMVGRLQVASAGLDSVVHLWDGFLSYDWMSSELSKREAEFCSYRSIKTLHVTFNIDAATPQDLETSIENMELLGSILRSGETPDVIFFGFQELIDLESKKLTAKSLLLGKKKAANDMGDRVSHQYRAWHDKLVSAVRLAMPPTCGYTVVLSESLVGLFTCIFVKQSEYRNVREAAISTVKTGMGGRYGNKGAVVARMVIDDTSICFANCHLAAGQKHVKQRNANVAEILESPTVFENLHTDPSAYVGGGDGTIMLDHELCFLSGDLNYRIDLRRDDVISSIQANRLGPLLEADQLRKELKGNPTLRLKPFSEAPILFHPTYKYDRGSNEWDSSEKSRIPAWCDRILWRSYSPDRIQNLEYRRWETTISDHRPVSAIFQATIKRIDPKAREIVRSQLLKAWEEIEADLLGKAKLFYHDPV
ncbi:DNase I-like protein [Violaceomyces palustris]|uniref:DNase I-like protein n=1 Tax=Violaceomyces palustris TaxID=1673888 RepID=A0ACD0NYT5_9BASI|nr:DNase I-like protein [Violaceomyces palustris]